MLIKLEKKQRPQAMTSLSFKDEVPDGNKYNVFSYTAHVGSTILNIMCAKEHFLYVFLLYIWQNISPYST